MPASYPMVLDLRNRRCLVVGGGAVAARKVANLVAAAARVTVVAPRVQPPIAELARHGALTWQGRTFQPADAVDQQLVFAATGERQVNAAVTAAAHQAGAWVNVVDDPQGCDFHLPATLRRGPLTVAVSTDGASPALAAWLRDRLQRQLSPALELLVQLVGRLRRLALGEAGVEAARFRSLLDSDVLADLERGDWNAVEDKVTDALGARASIRQMLRDFRREGR